MSCSFAVSLEMAPELEALLAVLTLETLLHRVSCCHVGLKVFLGLTTQGTDLFSPVRPHVMPECHFVGEDFVTFLAVVDFI